MNINLRQIVCPVCNNGEYNSGICPICSGFGILFSIVEPIYFDVNLQLNIKNTSLDNLLNNKEK